MRAPGTAFAHSGVGMVNFAAVRFTLRRLRILDRAADNDNRLAGSSCRWPSCNSTALLAVRVVEVPASGLVTRADLFGDEIIPHSRIPTVPSGPAIVVQRLRRIEVEIHVGL